jgi:hypothetical protein
VGRRIDRGLGEEIILLSIENIIHLASGRFDREGCLRRRRGGG